MAYLRLKCLSLWHILYYHFCFRYITWWYQSDFDTANHSTCHGANVIYSVHWIAVTVCVSEVRGSSLPNNCTSFPWYLLLYSTRALGEANILWISLMRRKTGNIWARLQLFVCGGSCGDYKYSTFGRQCEHKVMVLLCYENWGLCKRVVLECHPICPQLVGFHQGVIYGLTHPDRFVED